MASMRSLAISCSTLAAAGVLALGPAAATTAGGPALLAAHHASRQPSARFLAEARTALVRYLRRDQPQMLRGPAFGNRQAAGSAKSVADYNWAGYADISTKDGTFTKVSGSWTTPRVTCTAEDQITSDWVGLDGATDKTVEQDGTIGWCFEGTPTYFTWYEMYPAGTEEVGTSLQPGDSISASVSRSGSSYTLALTDSTHGANSFTKTATCATSTCLDTSAEWIAERPDFSTTGIAPEADFSSWKLTSGAETAAGSAGTIGSYSTVDEITCEDSTGTYAIVSPSSLSGGNSFTATWKNSY